MCARRSPFTVCLGKAYVCILCHARVSGTLNQVQRCMMPAAPQQVFSGVARSYNKQSIHSGFAKKNRDGPVTVSKARVSRSDARVSEPSIHANATSDEEPARDEKLCRPDDLADQAESPDESCLSSPESPLHGTVHAEYHMCTSQFKATPAHCCVRVTANARGAQCVAIGTNSPPGIMILAAKHPLFQCCFCCLF